MGLEEFLALGLIALAYGTALLIHAWGFLAVFAAGLAFRRVKAPPGAQRKDIGGDEAATHPRHATAYMTQAVLGFNEQLERIAEVALVIVVGAMLSHVVLRGAALWFLPLLFLVIRPLSVWAGLRGLPCSRLQLGMMSWFGIRGIGSIYYLLFAINFGLPSALVEQLGALTLAAVATSIVVHGVSVTPLMRYYSRREGRRSRGR
jgi:NhaP-type Na+/H+ or K+/H+ antiporter